MIHTVIELVYNWLQKHNEAKIPVFDIGWQDIAIVTSCFCGNDE